jgi:hypothetical protein
MADTGTPVAHNFYKKMRLKGSNSCSATTLVETLVASTLIAAFFATIFELNAVCLHYVDAGKESVAALQGIQNRIDTLRNLLFSDLTSDTYLQGLMATPADVPPGCSPSATPPCNPATYSSDFIRNKVTEVVTLSAYPTPDANNTQVTRGPGTSVTPTINSTDSNLANATLVKVNVTFTWNMTFGGRSGSEQSETIISAGTKK